MTIIGIDLGTTNSAVAYLKNGKPEIIENLDGGRTTPSVFQIKANGEIAVGQMAKDTAANLADRTVLEVKRLMGTEETKQLGGQVYRPEEISAHILRYLKKCAEDKLGITVTEAIITVPAYFSDSQRKATQKAGELAGLKVERILNEPTAAAIAYGMDNIDKDQHLLIYDLGGGTFDVSIVEMFDGILEVKASAGNNHLGGMDFDEAIVKWVVEQVQRETGYHLLQDGSTVQNAQTINRLKQEAEKVKKTLSSQVSTRFSAPFIAVHEGQPISVDLEFTRSDFETLIKNLALSTLVEIDKALEDAKLSIGDIDEVLLVGGSTRIPFIQEMVQKKFGKAPRKDVNPDEAVALGAAIQGGIKSGEISSETGIMVTDVAPYTLGTEVVKQIGGQLVPGFYDPIIQRNTTIPVTRSKTYYPIEDDQEEVLISVYQGEDTYVERNILLCDDLVLTGIPKGPAGTQGIEVKFHYDINGNLQIEATILSTGKKISRVLETQVGVMSDSEVAAAKTKLDQDWDKSELYSQVKTLIYRAEKMLPDLDAVDQNKVELVLRQLKGALSENDTLLVQKYEEELTDLLIELV